MIRALERKDTKGFSLLVCSDKVVKIVEGKCDMLQTGSWSPWTDEVVIFNNADSVMFLVVSNERCAVVLEVNGCTEEDLVEFCHWGNIRSTDNNMSQLCRAENRFWRHGERCGTGRTNLLAE